MRSFYRALNPNKKRERKREVKRDIGRIPDKCEISNGQNNEMCTTMNLQILNILLIQAAL